MSYLLYYSPSKLTVLNRYGIQPVFTRKNRRRYGRILSGIQVSLARGAVLRRNKYSKLIKNKPCLMHVTLTSSPQSLGTIADKWAILRKRLRRLDPNMSYCAFRTDEGVSGVYHVLIFSCNFIAKAWFESNWSDIFKATVVWSTQLYGNVKGIMRYLIGYLKHHEVSRFSMSQNWVYRGFISDFKKIFRLPYERAKLIWTNLLMCVRLKENVYFKRRVGKSVQKAYSATLS